MSKTIGRYHADERLAELLKAAAEAGDPPAFRSAYAEAVSVCNGCHAATGRPFIVIVEPTAPPVSNQQWEPPAPAGSPE